LPICAALAASIGGVLLVIQFARERLRKQEIGTGNIRRRNSKGKHNIEISREGRIKIPKRKGTYHDSQGTESRCCKGSNGRRYLRARLTVN
jgi:hypothetical protein